MIALTVTLAAAASSGAQGKSPIPSDEAQAKALELIKEVYGQEWENAKSSAQKQALATKLLQKAGESTDDTNRYVLLKVARDVAAQAGDTDLAFRAIDAMADSYEVDTYKLKGAAVSQAARAASSSAQSVAVARHSLAMIDEAVEKDDFVAAKYLGNLALDAARKGRDGQLVKSVVARNKEAEEIAEAYAKVADALVTLKKIPDDPEANLAVGKYHCFVRGDWDRGLPKLALGSDELLKKLAMKELEEVSGSAEQLALGDGWWDLAGKADAVARQQLQGRAAYWYREAMPGLSGLVKDKVANRLSLGKSDAEEWIVLYDGKSTRHWMTADGGQPSDNWVFRGKTILCKGKKGENLWTRGRFGDFLLELDFNTQGNSGVFVRTDRPTDAVQTGLEIQIDVPAARPTRYTCGAIYDAQAPSREMCRLGQWNRLQVEAHDNRIAVVLNGVQIIDIDLNRWKESYRNPDGSKNKFSTPLRFFKREGHIVLQSHGAGVAFRNVRIKQLDERNR